MLNAGSFHSVTDLDTASAYIRIPCLPFGHESLRHTCLTASGLIIHSEEFSPDADWKCAVAILRVIYSERITS